MKLKHSKPQREKGQETIRNYEEAVSAILNAKAGRSTLRHPEGLNLRHGKDGAVSMNDTGHWTRELEIRPMYPAKPFMFPWHGGFKGKWVTQAKDLDEPLEELLADGCETLWPLPSEYEEWTALGTKATVGGVRYVGIRRVIGKPKRMIILGPGDVVVYEFHIREWPFGAWRDNYMAMYIGWSPSRQLVYPVGRSTEQARHLWHEQEDFTNKLCIAASSVGMLRRHWVVNIKGKAAIQVAADEDAIKDLADIRDDPRLTESGRRNPILHWVNKHGRRLPSRRKCDVVQYMRGIMEFPLGPYNVRIVHPEKEWPHGVDPIHEIPDPILGESMGVPLPWYRRVLRVMGW